MSETNKSRNRARKLKPEATALLKRTLIETWQGSQSEGKYTRLARAEMLGIAIATSDRILSGQGVDRATILHAFKNLGLGWDESYLESEHLIIKDLPETVQDLKTRVDSNTVFLKTSNVWDRRHKYFVAGGLCIVLLLPIATFFHFKTRIRKADEAFLAGTKAYHSGDYQVAKKSLSTTRESAFAEDSASELASTLRLAGDLAMVEGHFSDAKEKFLAILLIRRNLRQPQTFPAIYDAIGDAETQLGQYELAEKSLGLALKGYEKQNDMTGIAMVSREFGTLYMQTNRLDLADLWFLKSLNAIRGQSKPDIEMDVRGRRAWIFSKNGDFRTALQDLDVCLKYWTGKQHVRWVAQTKLQIGGIKFLQGHTTSANVLLRESAKGFEEVGDKAGMAKVKNLLGS